VTLPGARGRLFVHRHPVDLRKHYDALWGLVTTTLGRNVLDGDVFVFIGKRCKRLKALWWDGTGVCVLCKRLDQGTFVAPWQRPGSGPLEVSAAEFALLLEGCQLVGRVKLSPSAWVPGTA
jgi:transposase